MDDHDTAFEKRCTKCGVVQPRSAYQRRTSAPDGLQHWCRDCHSVANASYHKQHPTASQRKSLLRLYGFDYDDVAAAIKAQGGRCPLCGDTFADHWRSACVDHDHATQRFRAILCRRCNAMLGQARDNPEVLIRAAEYLRSHQ